MRTEVVKQMAVDRGVCHTSGVRRSVDQIYPAPFRHTLRRHVRPILSTITRDMDQTVVTSHPDKILLDGRFGNREDRVVIFGSGVVLRHRTSRGSLLALIIPR